MRAISPHGNYSIQLFEGSEKKLTDRQGNPYTYTETSPVLAQFERGGLTKWEEEAVFNAFSFTGLPIDVHPLTTVAVFDVDAFVEAKYGDPDEREAMREKIEDRLSFLAKANPSQFIVVLKPAASTPWPSYDTDTVQEIIDLQERTGFDPTTIRLYEVENQNRDGIIDAMSALEASILEEPIRVGL